MSEVISPDYLLVRGFVEYESKDDPFIDYIFEIPFFNAMDRHYVEKDLNRRMFVVIECVDEPDSEAQSHHIFVQEDAGCGFVEIPHGWSTMPIEYFESIYYGIQGRKLTTKN